MNNYKYICLPISFLEANNISKRSFMEESQSSKKFLANLFKNIPPYLEIKNTFLIHNNFILILAKKENFTFENSDAFNSFFDFIKNTKFIDEIELNYEKKEISISQDISPYFYDLLYEFLV